MEIPGQERIAGYRIIRRLGAGSHSELYLGHADEADANGGAAVIVKVFHPSTDQDLIGDQVSVLTRAAPGSFARLVDLATQPGGVVVLVVERLTGPALPAVLEGRTRIAPGEAVTVLAPVVVALASLHALGFAHTTLSRATVRFQADGRPYVTGLGGLRRLPGFGGRHGQDAAEPGDGASRFDLIRADYARLALLMRGVFDTLHQTDAAARRAEALVAWFEMTATAVPFQPSLDELERRLFAWSPAAAVSLTESATPAPPVPARVDAVAAGSAPQRPGGPPMGAPATVAGAAAGRSSLVLRLGSALERSPLRLAADRVRVLAAARRGPLIVLACVATAATVLALTLMPPSPPAPAAQVPSGRSDEAAPVPSEPGPQRVVSSGEADAPASTGAIAGDDPVRAARALLAGRIGCLAAASVTCLDAFDQAGSAILEADTHAIDTGSSQPDASFTAGDVGELREHSGDLAIVALQRTASKGGDSEPASLLLVKGEAGWRLRQVFD
ncbi:serine/threonine-protein kinase [Cryobacterium tepidiphilum]|uniref:Protein kinase domain-containing protein n=1 Tax=Cryobacterium tepidiphilum TaxID=2486026 RepID=A0A3M8LA27_9MICO|nr:hypothetical protein [Cryobacterium tepidiphilum]RNE62353.1 hypothetical protein EEJ31_08075 [Cryobacterium tepidiphilum]